MAVLGAGAVVGALTVAWLGKFQQMGKTLLVVQLFFGGLVALFATLPITSTSYLILFFYWRNTLSRIFPDKLIGATRCSRRITGTCAKYLYDGIPRWHATWEPCQRVLDYALV